jgi:hypothetical protein
MWLWLIDCHVMKNGSREVKKESRIVRMKRIGWVQIQPKSSRGAQDKLHVQKEEG